MQQLLDLACVPAIGRHLPVLAIGVAATVAALSLQGCMDASSSSSDAKATRRSSQLTVICSDMDGTLLPGGAYPRRISGANAAALKQAMQQGVQVIIATGTVVASSAAGAGIRGRRWPYT